MAEYLGAVTVERFVSVVGPELAKDLRLATREAVNVSALAVTERARQEVRRTIGNEQRLSGQRVGSTWRVVDGERVRGSATGAGIRINPAYKAATSETNPTALVGARGPAHRIEHPRRGGYDIRSTRTFSKGAPPPSGLDIDELMGRVSSRARRGDARRYRAALRMPDGGYRYGVKGGAITNPPQPITRTFRLADRIVDQLAVDTMRRYLDLSVPKSTRRAV